MADVSVFDLLTCITALGCALVGGVFFAFSTFVMKALGRLPQAHGVAAMQSINIVVINQWFLSVFLGTTLAAAVLVIGSLFHWQGARDAWLLMGGVLYLAGTFGVTMVCNVPLNNALAAVAPETSEAHRLWRDYLVKWTAWNHVRTVAAVAAAATLFLALWPRR